MISTYLILSFFLFTLTAARSSDQTGADVDRGTFVNPSNRVRPRFRYWLPDGSVDPQAVRADVLAAGSIGAGGIEFLPFYNYGGSYGGPPAQVNWSTHGFGTPSFRKVFRSALEAHKERGMVMDFALGPNQGQGVPVQKDDEGLQWDLVPFSARIPSNGRFDAKIPGWGTGKLVALISARVLSDEQVWQLSTASAGQTNTTWSRLVLQEASLHDATSTVSLSTGKVTLSFPKTSKSQYYRIFAFYEKHSLSRNLEVHSNRLSTIWDDGSFVVDHFSSRGAKTVIQFWEENMLQDGLDELLKEAGNYGWEDSIEIHSNISWTPSLPSRFRNKYKYSLLKYLPLIIFRQNTIGQQASSPGAFECLLDTRDQWTRTINNYRSVLQDGYRDYLSTIQKWLNLRLGLQLSTQPTYGLPMDMGEAIPLVNAPECESLAFGDTLDGYRQFVGAANLAGKRVISNEIGAAIFKAYSYKLSTLLSSINRAVVSGVNQFVLHGQSFSGYYPGTSWPGYTPFSYLFSEIYSPKQPVWDHGFTDVMNYIARLQFITQSGVPRTDVAVYYKPSATNASFPRVYGANDLEDQGWTYTYLTASNLALPQARVSRGVLAPDGPAWKAIVIEGHQNLTLAATKKIRQFARAGLPVIISGGLPGYYFEGSRQAAKDFPRELAALVKTQNVHRVPAGQVAAKLTNLRLTPRVKPKANGKWYASWRHDSKDGVDYAFVLNESPMATVGEVTVSSTKTPYLLDPWTGNQSPILSYRRNEATTTIPLNLAGNQTVLISFSQQRYGNVAQTACHFGSDPSGLLGYSYPQPRTILLHTTASGSATLSTGEKIQSGKSKPARPFDLEGWQLVAEHWERPDDPLDTSVIAVKYNTTHRLGSLKPWSEVPDLHNVSGVGYYTTTFNWPPTEATRATSGAYISFPEIQHGLKVYVNDRLVMPFDYRRPSHDITTFLKNGKNEVLAVVPTTMWNYIQTFSDEILLSGSPATQLQGLVMGNFLPRTTDEGITGTVRVIPFSVTTVSC